MRSGPAGAGGTASPAQGTGGTASGEGTTSPGDPQAAVAGSATRANCSSYQRPSGGTCGGYYCGVDEQTLEQALPAGSKCGSDPAFMCDGRLVNVVGDCARSVKSSMLLATNSELRPFVRSCVYEDQEIMQKVSEECLACFIDAAECAGDNCLVECLAADSAMCDQCRLANDCQQPVFPCGGLPNPL